MSQDISIIIVFELRVILEGVTRDWSQFSQLGTCYIPQIVLEELEFLTKRAVSEVQEKTAREFFRFFPNSGWQVTQGMTHYEALTVMDGNNLSKNARLQVAIAESVYYLTLENTNKLVVLVTNQQNLREEVENLAQDNLVSLTLAQFTQWLRTKQKPISVSQKIAGFSNGKIFSPVSPLPPVKNSSGNNGNVVSPTSANYQPKAKVKPKNNAISIIISGFLALGALTFTVIIGWYFIQPQSFQEFWHKMGLPSLNQQK